MISAGDTHSVAINSKHSLIYLWGVYRNTVGGKMSDVYEKPFRIGEDEFKKKTIYKLLSGHNHTLILADDKVYAWGDPDTHVLGRMPLNRRKFKQGLTIEALGFKNVVDVYTGGYHSFLKQSKIEKNSKKKNVRIFAWGLNNYGQLGIGGTRHTFIPVELACRSKTVYKATCGTEVTYKIRIVCTNIRKTNAIPRRLFRLTSKYIQLEEC